MSIYQFRPDIRRRLTGSGIRQKITIRPSLEEINVEKHFIS